VIRFALVALTAAVAFASAMFLSTARAQTPGNASPSVTGEWTGKYICTQGITALNLQVASAGGNAIKATFSFGPLPENPEVPKGAYEMRGTYDPATRSVKLKGVKWIDAPLGYVMVGLDGQMAPSGQKITGYVPDLFGCTDFEVWRPVQLIG
jgi:hypothetical protein